MDVVLPQRYRLHDDPVLGSGGMGQVLRVQDLVLDVPVALKVVRSDLAQDARFRKRFHLEVRMSARLVHPRIVPLHDHGELPDGTPYLGLALADGGSWATFRESGVEWGVLSPLVLELLEGLSHLHARDVLHRDLKPENVLLHGCEGERHVWLADLGLANAGSSLIRTKGRREGTPGFMAPEQHRALPREYGPWTDLYALGVMLWEICTGARPFADDQTSADAPLPEFVPRPGMTVPAALPRILANLLSPEPLSRYDLAADLRTDWLALQDPSLCSDDPSVALVGTGTVAPSASEVNSSISLVDQEPPSNRTLFSFTASDVSPDGKDRRVPEWNRPLPDALPPEPPSTRVEVGDASASVALFALRDPPMAFRDRERSVLWSHARDCRDERRARVVLVLGPVGSGTSRLIDSVALDLEAGGWAEPVALNWNRPAGVDDGYAGAARALLRPWNESRASLEARLRRRLARERHRYDPSVEAEADLLVRWCGLLDEGQEPVAAGLGLREVYRHLDARTWRGLSLLLLNDPDLAEEEGDGLSIAEAILASEEAGVGDKPILVLAAISTDRLLGNPALRDRIDALVQAGAHRLDIAAFSTEQTHALLKESLNLEPGLAERVVDRCEGNPLFARQLLLEWVQREWLVDTGGLVFGLKPDIDAGSVMPSDATSLFANQLQRLAEASGNERRFRDTVHMAALVGRTLPTSLLMDFAGETLADFVAACELWEARDDRMAFQSRLHHEAFDALAHERTDVTYLHRRVGRAWLRWGEAQGVSVGIEVGRHAARGQDPALALEHLMDAAQSAHRSGRPGRMLEAMTLAQDVVRMDDELAEQKGEVDLWLGRAHRVTGDAEAASACFTRALRHGSFMGDTRLAIEARCGLGWTALAQGDLSEAEVAWRKAVEASKGLDDLGIQAKAIVGKAWLEQQKRNFEGADILFTRAVNRLTKVGDERGVAEATLGQAFVARRTGAFSDAQELYEEAIEASRHAEDPLGLARAMLGQGIALRQIGQREAAESRLVESLSLSEEMGAIHLVQDGCLAMADLHRDADEPGKARNLYRDHLAWAAQRTIFESRIAAHLALARMALADGDDRLCNEQATAAVALLNAVPGHWLWATYRLLVAALLAARHDEEQTWQWLWQAQELGLRDTVDRDNASDLERIFTVASAKGWSRTQRLSGRLLLRQWIRLGEHARAQQLQYAMDEE